MTRNTGAEASLVGTDGVVDGAPHAPPAQETRAVPAGREHAIEASSRGDGCYGLQSHYLALQAIHDALTHALELEAAQHIARDGRPKRGEARQVEALLNQRTGVVMFLKAAEGGSLHLWPPFLREALERIDWSTQRYRHPKVDDVRSQQDTRYQVGQRVWLPDGRSGTVVEEYPGAGPQAQTVYAVVIDACDGPDHLEGRFRESDLTPVPSG